MGPKAIEDGARAGAGRASRRAGHNVVLSGSGGSRKLAGGSEDIEHPGFIMTTSQERCRLFFGGERRSCFTFGRVIQIIYSAKIEWSPSPLLRPLPGSEDRMWTRTELYLCESGRGGQENSNPVSKTAVECCMGCERNRLMRRSRASPA